MSDVSLAYIVSASHSGSTLLAMLLNSHPDIRTVGELKFGDLGEPDSYRCSCKKDILDCQFWKDITQKMAENGEDFDVRDSRTDFASMRSKFVRRLTKPLHRGKSLEICRDLLLSLSPSWLKQYPIWQRRNLGLVRALSEVSGVSTIVDSSKTSVRAKYLQRIDGLEVKFIRLVRDGRAVALTYMDETNFADAKDPSLRGGGHGRRKHRERSMADAANEWLRSNMEAEELLKTVPTQQYLRVRYEDICLDTSNTLRQITEFLGLEQGTAYSRFKDVDHHVIGNGMRLDGSSEVKLDDRWKSVLSNEHLQVFDSVAGHLNRTYGYD